MRSIRVACLVLAMGTSPYVASAGTLYLDPMFGVQKTSNIVYGQGLVDNGAALLDLMACYSIPGPWVMKVSGP